MKKIKYLAALIALSFKTIAQVPYTPVNANRILVRAFPFQNFTYDARSAGLAEAGVAINPDCSSSLMNPAKLVYINKLDTSRIKVNKRGIIKDSIVTDTLKAIGLSLNYTPYYRNLIGGMNLWSGSIFKSKNYKAFGLTVKFFDAGNTEIYSDTRQFIRNFKSKEFSVSGFYSFLISKDKQNSLSLGLKYIYSNLSNSATTRGIITKPVHALSGDIYFFHNGRVGNNKKEWLNYGASLTSIGSKVSYGDYKIRSFQPTLLKIGVAQNFVLRKLDNKEKETILMLTVDANKLLVPTPPVRDKNNNILEGKDEASISGIGTIFQSWGTAPDGFAEHLQEIYYCLGAELQLKQTLFARAGYYTQNKKKGDIHYLSLGLGGKIKGLSLDAAYLIPNKRNDVLKNTFRVSLNFSM